MFTQPHKKRHFWRDAFVVLIALCFVGGGAMLLWFSSIEIPDLASFDQRILGQSTKIFDRTGKILLYDLGQNMRRTVVPFADISPNIKEATLAIEDADFYNHSGVRISSLIRATFANLSAGEFAQGGSTITQQVVKNTLLTREKTISRKLKEIFLSVKLEQNLTKDEIFNLYLNETPYGGTLYGVEEASESFFGKSSSDVTIAEAAYIASIPQSPTYYSPFGKHKQELEDRKNLTLKKMLENKFVTEAEYEQALNEKVVFKDQTNNGIKAPHFVMYIRDLLEQKYGDNVATKGLRVTTTLDYEMQKTAEDIIKTKAIENGKLYHATNAALVAIDPLSGQILSMVGSRDYFDDEVDGQFNVATAKRQPGSSFKPFVYAAAFNLGYLPETVLFDVPTQFSPQCGADNFSSDDPCYSPQNYDGKFRGPISLRNALAQSINIPAVKLLYLVGINNAIDLAEKMGISTLGDRSRFGLSLVLGGGEVTLLDMTSAYGVFANSGVKHDTTGILKVEDKNGAILEKYEDHIEEVLPKNTVLTVSDVLSDNTARTPVFGARSSLYFDGRSVAAKTGTTNDYRDTWVVGYTPNLVVGAWAGNNDNTPIARQVAGYIVAPMWHQVFEEFLKKYPNQPFEKPESSDLSKVKPALKGAHNNHSILYSVKKDDPAGATPSNPNNDPQFSHWEYSVQKWLGNSGFTVPTSPNSGTPSTNSTLLPNPLSVEIISPQDGLQVTSGSRVSVSIKATSAYPIKQASYYLGSEFLGSSLSSPFDFSFLLGNKGVIGTNYIKVIVTDSNGNQSSKTVSILKK